MPIVNALLMKEDLNRQEERFPLDLVLCTQCALAQVLETVRPEKLFREYLYFSSFSETMLRHAEQHVNRLIENEKLGPPSLALEIESNDGYLRQYFRTAGIPVYCIVLAHQTDKPGATRG